MRQSSGFVSDQTMVWLADMFVLVGALGAGALVIDTTVGLVYAAVMIPLCAVLWRLRPNEQVDHDERV